ncbi:MAG: TIGR03668 family PPOX class F420-dependent oxidoreductase [Actinobacteria bacterium]|nr:TIGR03668 family PPOX class F420-dependent oxidoreductase [Actinomycetota bacterium]
MDLDPGLRERVARARVARLATLRPDGHPHIVPITFAVEHDVIVTAIDHKPKTTADLQRLKNIEAHPVASVLVDHYEDDWSRLWWVRGDGRAGIAAEGIARERAIEQLAHKYDPYLDSPPRGPVIVVTVRRWTSWSP